MTILSEAEIISGSFTYHIKPLDRVRVKTAKGSFIFSVAHIIKDELGVALVSALGRHIRPESFPIISHTKGIM